MVSRTILLLALLAGACRTPLWPDKDETGCLQTWYLDDDGDGFGVADTEVIGCAAPPDYVAEAGDCDDADPTAFPGATEACDGHDDDCDGAVDEDLPTSTGFPDDDGDGWGRSGEGVTACRLPAGWSPAEGDCDDADPAIHPGATDTPCDGVDADCDGAGAGAVVAVTDEDEYADLQSALDAGAPEVRLCAGTHLGAWQVSAGATLTLVPWDPSGPTPVLRGDGLHRILTVEPGADLTLQDLAFEEGDPSGEDEDVGGVVYARQARVVMDSCTVTASREAVMIRDEGGEASLEIRGGTLAGNEAPVVAVEADGTTRLAMTDTNVSDNVAPLDGVVSVLGLSGSEVEIAVEGGVFERNEALSTYGSALTLVVAGELDLDIAASRFDANVSGARGGAVSLQGSGPTRVDLQDTGFSGNRSSLWGGAVAASLTSPESSFLLDHVTFDGNYADESGGAVSLASPWFEIASCTFTGNTSAMGGALALLPLGAAEAGRVADSTFEGNEANRGGAIYALPPLGTALDLALTDTVVDGNRATLKSAGVDGETSEGSLRITLAGGRVVRNVSADQPAGGITLGLQATLACAAVDWGEGDATNAPGDLRVIGAAGEATWSDLGSAESFTCAAGACAWEAAP